MSYNILDCLQKGDISPLVRDFTLYDERNTIGIVRNSPKREQIINGFLDKAKEEFSSFCFNIIYDIPEFANEAYELLKAHKVFLKDMTSEMLKNILNRTPLGIKILFENFDYFLSTVKDENYYEVIFKYAFDSDNEELLHRLSRYSNLHTRYLFMRHLIKRHPSQIDQIYDDITKYTTSVTYEPYEQITFLPILMDPEEISELAVLLLKIKRKDDYKKLKDYIMHEYKYNYLASKLLVGESRRLLTEEPICEDESIHQLRIQTFKADSNELFRTSADFRYAIFLRYRNMISDELINEFISRIKYFLGKGRGNLGEIYRLGLGQLLEEWTEKYMDLSRSKEYGFVGGGTTCDCYRIGDYVIKLVATKWSYEDVICPNIYLIAKNYEEIYLRLSSGIVNGGLEVQKYLTRSASDIPKECFAKFDDALSELGYRRNDSLINGRCGDNSMLLDTYLDADCADPEKLPDWFKENPLVLVDRDMIYKKSNPNVKQLSSIY